MGLDQYATKSERNAFSNPEAEVDLHLADSVFPREDFYSWRKHSALQGWMYLLYMKKGGADPEFNCSRLLLNGEDLEALQEAIKTRSLPKTEGFFFGTHQPDDESDKDDLEFITLAREALAEGLLVTYHAWY